MLSAEGLLLYNNQLVLADQNRHTHRLLEQLISTKEKQSRQLVSKKAKSSQASEDDENDDDEDDTSDEDDNEIESEREEDAPPKASHTAQKTKGKQKTSGKASILESALQLYDRGQTLLVNAYKDWIVNHKKDVRKTRSKTKDLSIDFHEFFETFLPSSGYVVTEADGDFMTDLNSHPDTVKEELYLGVGRTFATNEPDITSKANRRQVLQQWTLDIRPMDEIKSFATESVDFEDHLAQHFATNGHGGKSAVAVKT
ncbi:hypothetical protein LTR99_003098 [Exophiala xenobiotica]|uniref:Uncharacterized protein n=1 Tax=Vermiconidia calcicola TaxID=1690605 RepID=A0AAV9Q9G8_9PEZI|nr:hypothetical protein H2202_010302 [Exophiala xenobiotica]KAK5531636.1 hypothetical protein LTR23_009913 [Chaetothyriales sp. CCFEE 6169]KAK5538764.1 hypothetical protein LTR25_004308 [Vermiconidia calcicola]KAK5194595.1 hypothetical protein LTR92_005839 [Exophiala xenobiotica]KAK5212698.1 hypothetical protein LTR41_001644 [Exophiala xenobiotica]